MVEVGAVVGGDALDDLVEFQARDLLHVDVAQRIERDHGGAAD